MFFFQELEKLSEKFSENVLDATKKFEKLITDKKEIDGLPASALGLAAQTAVSKVSIMKCKQKYGSLGVCSPCMIFYADKLFC